MNAGNHWTEEDERFLIDNKDMPNRKLADKLGRTISSIKNKKVKLDLVNPHRNPVIYEVVQGYEVLATGTAQECADELGLKRETIYFYASTIHSERAKENSMIAYRIDDVEGLA